MLITTKFLGPTNTRGGRVKATFDDPKRGTITLGWNHAIGSVENHDAAARALVTKWNDAVDAANPTQAVEYRNHIRGAFYRVSWTERGTAYALVTPYNDAAFVV